MPVGVFAFLAAGLFFLGPRVTGPQEPLGFTDTGRKHDSSPLIPTRHLDITHLPCPYPGI